ncbi:MAG: 30S ribosomal protein S15 [Planctomycetota bacterium]
MAISKDSRRTILAQNRIHEKDSGSPEVQIALLTANIQQLTEHMRVHPKDFHSRRGLIQMVNRRNKLLRYLSSTAHDRYLAITDKLGLRR